MLLQGYDSRRVIGDPEKNSSSEAVLATEPTQLQAAIVISTFPLYHVIEFGRVPADHIN